MSSSLSLEKRDIRADLLKTASELKLKAKKAAEEARAAGKTSNAEQIEKQELQIEQLVQDIKATTAGTDAEKATRRETQKSGE